MLNQTVKTSTSLCDFKEITTLAPPQELSPQEKKILEVLDSLPSCILEKPPSKWCRFWGGELGLCVPMFAPLFPVFFGMYYHSIVVQLMFFPCFVVFASLSIFYSIKLSSKMVRVDPKTVEHRKRVLASGMETFSHSVIRQRLAELYVVSDHPRILFDFWKNLSKNLEKEEVLPSLDDLDERVGRFRKNLKETGKQDVAVPFNSL